MLILQIFYDKIRKIFLKFFLPELSWWFDIIGKPWQLSLSSVN